ncbi:MAG: hypothetical protein JSW27_10165, partial [Phycisphaerales bacterium]
MQNGVKALPIAAPIFDLTDMHKAISRKNIWTGAPPWVKSTVGKVLRLVPPAWLFGRRYRQQCEHALAAQWWPIERSRAYQLERLRAILSLAHEKSSFYRRTFDEVGFSPRELRRLSDIRRLPMIDRKTVLENAQEMLTGSINVIRADSISTGGTSGGPLRFYINANISSVEYAFLTTSWRRVGYDIKAPMAVLRGRVVKPDRDGLYHEYDPVLRHHYYSSFHLSDKNMALYLKHIATIGPCFLHVYPSTAAALARLVRRRG